MTQRENAISGAVSGELRARAEERLNDTSSPPLDESMPTEEIVRELRLQRIELELENEQLRREKKDREKELAQFRDLYIHAPVGYLSLGLDGSIEHLNYRAAELLGSNRSSLRQTQLTEHVHPSCHGDLDNHFQQLREGSGVKSSQICVDLPTGTRVFLKLVSIAAEAPSTGELECRSALFDVTRQHRAEEQKDELKQQLREAHRMETLGRLAGGIAHDFNNLLTLIIGYSKLAMNQLGDDKPVSRHAREINKAGHHAAELIEQLLAFTRSDTANASDVEVNQLIREMESMFSRLLGDDIKLQIRLQEPLGTVRFDSSQFQQVLMNLVVNVREALSDGGTLVIRTRRATLDDERAERLGLQGGAHIVVEVEDDGHGISQEVIPHIFEPFFTTKSTSRNQGFGLSTTYGIVSQHGGAIDVDSQPSVGTTFRVYLALTSDPDVDESPDRPTVMIVDDQPDLREYASLVLKEMDLEVITARGAEEALLLSRACGDDLDLVVTDVTMPGMSGPELLEEIRKYHLNTRVLYMSGHDRQSLCETKGIERDAPFLEKPFTPEHLAELVRSLVQD